MCSDRDVNRYSGGFGGEKAFTHIYQIERGTGVRDGVAGGHLEGNDPYPILVLHIVGLT